eukprot:SAG31_NODE_33064_length_348_cov_0.835341_1_plen_31_part_10
MMIIYMSNAKTPHTGSNNIDFHAMLRVGTHK